MKTYIGDRTGGNCSVLVKDGDKTYPLAHVELHSPTGLNWGYSGSGPADTALSILADHFGERGKAETLHQDFKWAFVAGFKDHWELTSEQIEKWLDERAEQNDQK